MKVPKSLLQTIALAIVVSTTATACSSQKEQVKPNHEIQTTQDPPHNIDNCPACGMG